METHVATLIKNARDWLVRLQTRMRPCANEIITRLKIHSTESGERLHRWLQLDWPPFRQGVLTKARQVYAVVLQAARQTLMLTARFLLQARVVLINIARHGRLLALLTYGRLQQWLHHNWPPISDRLLLYINLTRLDKPVGILLLLWPTLWAVWIAAEGLPTLHLLAVFTLGVVLTRSAGCVFNDMADRKFDSQVRRTAKRPLASGRIGSREALLVACVLLLIAFMLVLTTNRYTVLLSFVAIPLAVIYPLMKRYTYVPQFFLGLAFSWGIPMAFAAQTGEIPDIAWLLFMANILWSVVYDTIYAMVDREDDMKAGIKSTAILFDDADRTIIGILQGMFLAVMIITGIQIEAKMLYYVSLGPAAALMVYHQYLIRHRLQDDCFRAFLNNHWVGLIIFVGICLNYL
jgi:4-hydroxybenzoate polyprenyltransferase